MATGKVNRERKGESGKRSLAGRSSEEIATKKGNKRKWEGEKSGRYEGVKWFPPYYLYSGGAGHRSKYDLGPERKDARELVLDHLSEEGQREVEEKEETESA